MMTSMALLLWILHAVTVALWLSCREMRSGKLTSTARRAAFLDACGTEFGAAAADVVSCAAVLACWRASRFVWFFDFAGSTFDTSLRWSHL